MHPGWRRCSFLAYCRCPRSSRLASRAPRRPRCCAAFMRCVLASAVLGQDKNSVRANADRGPARHVVHRIAARERVVTRMIAEVRAVPLPIAVETHAPLSLAWEPQDVPVVAAVGEIGHHHDIVAGPAIGPT